MLQCYLNSHPAKGKAMNSEDSPPAKKPRRRAQAAVDGGGAIAQGNGTTAVGKGGQLVRGDMYKSTTIHVHQAAPSDAGAAELRQGYLAWLVTQANRLPLFLSDSGNMVQLPSVYTALLTAGSDDSLRQPAAARGTHQSGDGEPRQGERLSALEALDRERSLVLMGGPGSGKTTFLNFVALCLAGELQHSATANLKLLRQPIPPEPDAPPADAKPQPQRWTHGALLPVCVVLRDFAASLPPARQAARRPTPAPCGVSSSASGPSNCGPTPTTCSANCSAAAG
jgi:hypothetical protein